MVSWGKQKGVIRVFRAKKAVVQVLLIAAGIAMVCFGALRGEAGAVLRQGDPAVLGVCRHWIRKNSLFPCS